MSAYLPTVTIIIPARPDSVEIQAIAGVQQLDYPPDKLEIIIARGRQPSVQRNQAIHAAHGEVVYFLDDDSVPLPDNLRKAAAHFAQADVQMVGGPNLCPPDAPELEQMLALTMGSHLAFASSRARYRRVGQVRVSGEKELILCNLLARRATLLALGGFDEALYPNEENALMDAMQKNGGKLIYDPALVVHRRPRPHLPAFIKMLMNYGRGRAEQFRLHPTWGSALNFVPPLFLLYLFTIPWLPRLLLFPLPLYVVLALGEALLILGPRRALWTPHLVCLIFMSHVFYGLGFWRGWFTRPKPPAETVAFDVKLEKISL